MIVEKHTDYGYIAYFKNDMAFTDSLAENKIYEQDFILQYLQKHIMDSEVILDIGAHAGSHTILYKHINPYSKIYCFEPQKKMFDLLVNNISVNKFKNVEAFNVALANISIEAELNSVVNDGDTKNTKIEYGSDKRFNLGGVQVGSGGEQVHTITIDSLNLKSCDFIKIDVEGFEPLVLLGGEQTIKKYKPKILFESNYKTISKEIANKFKVSYPVKESQEILKDFGYKNIELIDGIWNYLAIY
jgi:FkbM family methyltransferase